MQRNGERTTNTASTATTSRRGGPVSREPAVVRQTLTLILADSILAAERAPQAAVEVFAICSASFSAAGAAPKWNRRRNQAMTLNTRLKSISGMQSAAR